MAAIERPTLLVLVRHGESQRNKAKGKNPYLPEKEELTSGIRGTPDHKIELTSLGVNQAQATGILIKQRYGIFNVAYHSGYVRTENTLEAILGAYTEEERAQMKIRESFYLREREPGYTYDMTKEEVDEKLPFYRGYFEQYGYFLAQPPGGESQAQVCQRIYTFIGILFRQRAGMKVLIVAHGGTIRAIRFNLEKWNRARYEQEALSGPTPNCGITSYRYNSENRRLELDVSDEVAY